MTTLSLARPQNLELRVDSTDAFDVREFVVDEGVNSLFSIELVVRCANPAVDLESTIGSQATFRVGLDPLAMPDTPSPSWDGVIADFEQVTSEDTGLSTYRIQIVPTLWLLTQRTNCRVFQQRTDLQVVLAMFEEWGLAHESMCTESYKPKKYRVQYQETDFAFVSRLLEDSGISFVLEQRESGTTVVLRDAPETVSPRAMPLEHVNETTAGPQLYATGLRAERGVRSGRTTFADHDPRLPNQPLLAQAKTSSHALEARLESFVYQPGAFKFGNAGPKDTPTADDRGRVRTDPDEGRLIAERDAAVRVARSQRFSFQSNCLELRAGTVLSLGNHAITEKFKKLLLTKVKISGTSESEVRVSAEAVSGDVAHKPERKTPRPTIHGVECATVVGPQGETIHCDEFGRVRVQFHWDRYGKMDELSSCWISVNQPWGGEGFGMINLPRIGQEVLVSFLGGNPEEPVIVGRIFTNLERPPFTLPAAKNESGFRSKSVPETGGYNLLRYVDTAGSELVEGRAEKDMYTRVNNDKELSVGHDRKMSIENDDEEKVAGNQREWVGKDKHASVADNYTSIVGKDRTLKTVEGMTSKAKAHFIVADDSIEITVGNSFIYMDKDHIHVSAPLIKKKEDNPRRNHRDSGGIWATGANYSAGAKLPVPDDGE
ncbi:MAG: type VI secretion system tip protein VgrG [Polyangiaceae bacterium]|nr:type VI secretion system tip protein VgrG [Polyangiaceae bacterium]